MGGDTTAKNPPRSWGDLPYATRVFVTVVPFVLGVGALVGMLLGRAAWDRGVSTTVLFLVGSVVAVFSFAGGISIAIAIGRGAAGKRYVAAALAVAVTGFGLGTSYTGAIVANQPTQGEIDELMAYQSVLVQNRDNESYLLQLSDGQGVDQGWFAIPARATVRISNLPGPIGSTYSFVLTTTTCQIQYVASLTPGRRGPDGSTALEISSGVVTVQVTSGANLTPAQAAETAPACVRGSQPVPEATY